MLCCKYINILNNMYFKRTLYEHKYFFKFKINNDVVLSYYNLINHLKTKQ